MFKKIIKNIAKIFVLITVMMLGCVSVLAAATFTPLTGITVEADNSKSWGVGTESSMSSGVITCKAVGGFSSKTNNISISNTSNETLIITFDYSISNADSYTGFSSASGTSYKLSLEAGASASFSISSGTFNTTTLTMSNFQFVIAEATVSVSATHSTKYGTVTMDGESIANWAYAGTDVTVTDEGATFTATKVTTTNSNSHFVAWIDPDTNEILSLSASYTLIPTTETVKIKAVFSYTTLAAWFQVGDYLYQGLDVAVKQAQAGKGNVITLRSNGSLLANKSYEIPEGYTLLVPFDSAGTLYKTEPASTSSSTSVKIYRTLYIRAGASLTIKGEMSVSGKHHYGKGNQALGCAPAGYVGRVRTYDNSSIVVNGKLYAWGVIYGTGAVTVNSGGSVYELLQIEDFRGGSETTGMKNKVFPFSQYYAQNIEISMTLKHGAKEYAYTSLYMGGSAVGKTIDFIGSSGCMFTTAEGSTITKSYDGTTDRLIISYSGNGSMESIGFDFGILYSFDSADYVLPVNSNITVKMNSGTVTINQDVALLPGSRFEIAEDATIKIGSGKSVFIYDQNEWGPYCWATTVTEETCLTKNRNQPLDIARYVASRGYTRTNKDLIDSAILINGTLDVSEGYIYTTAGGANIYSDDKGKIVVKAGTATETYQYIQGYTVSNDANEVVFTQEAECVEIPINSAWLKNVDGTFVKTGEQTGITTYEYIDGFWRYENVAVWYDEGNNERGRYLTLGRAIAAYNGTGYIQMTDDSIEPGFSTTETVYLDLFGKNVTLTTEASIPNLYGIDSTTNAYTADKAGKITGSGTSNIPLLTKYQPDTSIAPKYYVKVVNDDGYSFNRAGVSVTGIQYTLNTDYAVFQGVFRGTDDVATALKDVGFRFNESTDTWYNPNETDIKSDGIAFSYARKFADVTSVQALLSFDADHTTNNVAVSMLRSGIADLIKGAGK